MIEVAVMLLKFLPCQAQLARTALDFDIRTVDPQVVLEIFDGAKLHVAVAALFVLLTTNQMMLQILLLHHFQRSHISRTTRRHSSLVVFTTAA